MCHCGNKIDYSSCCETYITGKSKAANPELLMRSRYSAYVVHQVQYIADTYALEQQKDNRVADILAFAQSCQFIKLEILGSNATQVEFKAHYIQDGQHHVLHERSNFVQQGQAWFYQDGKSYTAEAKTLSRSALCPCASGKKFKRCHGA